MLKWKKSVNKLILQVINYDNEVIREIQIDMRINGKKYHDAEEAKKIIISQLNKWYGKNLNVDKETIENFLYLNDYCVYEK